MDRLPEDGTFLRPPGAVWPGPSPRPRAAPVIRLSLRLDDGSLRDCGLWPGGNRRCGSGPARNGTPLFPGSGWFSCPARGGDAFSAPCQLSHPGTEYPVLFTERRFPAGPCRFGCPWRPLSGAVRRIFGWWRR